MKKLLKIIAGVIVAGVVLLIVAAVALPMLVDPQDIKNQLSTRVKAETGRDLSIPGEVKLSVFPWLGATLGEVTLGNAAGFSAPVFASTRKVDVRVKLMPLFSRRLEMDTVTVHGLTLNMERNKQGAGNWGDLATGGGAKDSDSSATPSTSGEAAGQGLAGFAIGGIDVRDGALSFTDQQAGQSWEVKNLNLTTGALTPGKAVDLELGFDLASAQPALSAQVKASASVDANADTQSARINGLNITVVAQGESLPGGSVEAKLGADLAVDGLKHSATVRNLTVNLLDLALTGALDISAFDKAPAVTGELNVAQFNPREWLKALGQSAPQTSDANALSRLSLSATLSGGPDALALKPLSVKLDESTLSGEAKVSNFAAPAVHFALQLDAIDLDRYLPPGSEAPPATPGAAASQATAAPTDSLRALDAAGTFVAGKVKVAKLNLANVKATLRAKNGLIRLSPVAADLYQGKYAGDITLDARKKVPAIALNETLSGVQAGPLLMDLQGKEPLTGTANVKAKLNARGSTPEAIKKTLSGNLGFEFLNGAIKGVNIGKMIRDARGALKGGSSNADEPAQTDFAQITGTAKVTNGVISNQDLRAKSPLLRIAGKGKASLPGETIDYKVTATVVATSKGQGGKGLGDLAGVPIPVHVTGTFTDPKYGLDMAGLGEALAKSKAKELVNAQKGKVVEKAKKKLGDSVGKILGGDNNGGGLMNKLLGN
ncbi:MAG: AsmA protein [Gammaproteobacteria bacterium]|jgi:AsmA protein